jgi:DMSO/TMAO reductase YedYZ molybdopterin-dependent catalytic subunit
LGKWNKIIEDKLRMVGRKVQSSSKSDSSRLPPGQAITNKFPVLDLGVLPNVDVTNWTLRVFGLVKNELELNFDDLKKYPQVEKVLDFHCVTHWSKLDVPWKGVRALDVISNAGIMNNAKFVTLYSYDRYTTNISLEVLLDEDVIIAHQVFNQPLSQEHGGPVRLVVPKLYGWKSAKWLKAIEIHKEDRRGFWELRGYHNDANPWEEERYSE